MLHATRPASIGLDPLQPTEIEAWMNLNAIPRDDDARREMYLMIVTLDQAWLSWNAKREPHGDAEAGG